ncbi:hypothetical protein D3C76_1205570 [compost metagenome]
MGICAMSSCTAAMRAHCSTQRGSASALKKLMLSAIEPANSTSSCSTVALTRRSRSRLWLSMATPSSSTLPLLGARMPSMTLSKVVLPPPEGPTIASESPASIRTDTSSST